MHQHHIAGRGQGVQPVAHGILTAKAACAKKQRDSGVTPFGKRFCLFSGLFQHIGRKDEHNAAHERSSGQSEDGMPPEGHTFKREELFSRNALSGTGSGHALPAPGRQQNGPAFCCGF